jgi:chromosome partitioning protein
MSNKKFPYIIVVGNEKGGAGKTTCSMHLIVSLLEKGYKVSSIDADCRQSSLTSYMNLREKYNEANPDHKVLMPDHYLLKTSKEDSQKIRDLEEKEHFENILANAMKNSEYIVIDTPGTYTNLSSIAHSFADTVVTPINDSFVDLDVMAKIDGKTMKVLSPSIYSAMVWEQKLEKAKRDQGSVDWVVIRNRVSSHNATNKKNVEKVLGDLAKRISFRLAAGFGERVIFRELFLQGLTLLDLKKAKHDKKLTISHVAAKHELRMLLQNLGL